MSERDFVELKSDGTRGAMIRLSFPYPRDPDGYWTLHVDIDADDLKCSHGVLTYLGDGLAGFVGDLATGWRGWDGTRRWDALEHGMSIEATHRGSRVELLFILRRDYESDAWEIRLPILVAPGESLSDFARAVSTLVPARGHS